MRRVLGLATVLAMVALLLVPSAATLGTSGPVPQSQEQPPIETPTPPPAPAAGAPQDAPYVDTVTICHFQSAGLYETLTVGKATWDEGFYPWFGHPHHPVGHDGAAHTGDIWPAYQYRLFNWARMQYDYLDHGSQNWDTAGQEIYSNDCVVPPTTGFITFVKSIDNWLPEQGPAPLDMFELTYAGPPSGHAHSGDVVELPFGDYTVGENVPGAPNDQFVPNGVSCEPDGEVVLQALTEVASLSREQRNWTCTIHNEYKVPWFTKMLAPFSPGSASDFSFHVVNGKYVYDIPGSELLLSPDGRTGTYYGRGLVGEFTITENVTSTKWTATYELDGLVSGNACNWIPEKPPVEFAPANGGGEFAGPPVCQITNYYHPTCEESGQSCAVVTPGPTPAVTPTPAVATPSPAGTVLPTTGTPRPTGKVLPAEGTPRPTLPVTSAGSGGDGGSGQLLLLALAIVASAGALVTVTRRQTTR